MDAYKVTFEERRAIETLNEAGGDDLVIVCDTEEHGCIICLVNIDDAELVEYREILPGSLVAAKRVVLEL